MPERRGPQPQPGGPVDSAEEDELWGRIADERRREPPQVNTRPIDQDDPPTAPLPPEAAPADPTYRERLDAAEENPSEAAAREATDVMRRIPLLIHEGEPKGIQVGQEMSLADLEQTGLLLRNRLGIREQASRINETEIEHERRLEYGEPERHALRWLWDPIGEPAREMREEVVRKRNADGQQFVEWIYEADAELVTEQVIGGQGPMGPDWLARVVLVERRNVDDDRLQSMDVLVLPNGPFREQRRFWKVGDVVQHQRKELMRLLTDMDARGNLQRPTGAHPEPEYVPGGRSLEDAGAGPAVAYTMGAVHEQNLSQKRARQRELGQADRARHRAEKAAAGPPETEEEARQRMARADAQGLPRKSSSPGDAAAEEERRRMKAEGWEERRRTDDLDEDLDAARADARDYVRRAGWRNAQERGLQAGAEPEPLRAATEGELRRLGDTDNAMGRLAGMDEPYDRLQFMTRLMENLQHSNLVTGLDLERLRSTGEFGLTPAVSDPEGRVVAVLDRLRGYWEEAREQRRGEQQQTAANREAVDLAAERKREYVAEQAVKNAPPQPPDQPPRVPERLALPARPEVILHDLRKDLRAAIDGVEDPETRLAELKGVQQAAIDEGRIERDPSDDSTDEVRYRPAARRDDQMAELAAEFSDEAREAMRGAVGPEATDEDLAEQMRLEYQAEWGSFIQLLDKEMRRAEDDIKQNRKEKEDKEAAAKAEAGKEKADKEKEAKEKAEPETKTAEEAAPKGPRVIEIPRRPVGGQDDGGQGGENGNGGPDNGSGQPAPRPGAGPGALGGSAAEPAAGREGAQAIERQPNPRDVARRMNQAARRARESQTAQPEEYSILSPSAEEGRTAFSELVDRVRVQRSDFRVTRTDQLQPDEVAPLLEVARSIDEVEDVIQEVMRRGSLQQPSPGEVVARPGLPRDEEILRLIRNREQQLGGADTA